MARARITDVATHAGVSRAAVSKVIRGAYGVSDSMRERVESSIAALDYRPQISARSMRGASFTIGVESPALIGTDYLPSVIDGASQVLSKAGYDLIALPIHNIEDSVNALDRLVDRQVDGILALGTILPSEDLARIAERTSVVAIGRHEDTETFDTVNADDEAGTRLALDHLIQLGHRRIVHVTLGYSGVFPSARDGHIVRAETYEARMRELGLPAQVIRLTPEMIYSDPGAVRVELVEFLSSTNSPTAVFAANDGLALEVLTVLDELGQLGANISVVGYDGASITAHSRIGLTTVDQFGRSIGGAAATLLIERIKGRGTATHQVLAPRLRIGKTTFAPRR